MIFLVFLTGVSIWCRLDWISYGYIVGDCINKLSEWYFGDRIESGFIVVDFII